MELNDKEGYDLSLFVENLPGCVICPICHQVIRDPYRCPDEHSFCKVCIFRWQKLRKTCPCDRKRLDKVSLVKFRTISNLIDDCKVKCPTSLSDEATTKKIRLNENETQVVHQPIYNSCLWTGEFKNMNDHLSTCEYKEIKCVFSTCKYVGQRRNLAEHKVSCNYRNIICRWCKNIFPFLNINSHENDDCKEREINCPNNCVVRIKAKDINSHKLICKLENVDCSYKDIIGCNYSCLRQDLDKHLQDVNIHFTQVINILRENKKEIKKKKKRNIILDNEVKLCKDKIFEVTWVKSERIIIDHISFQQIISNKYNSNSFVACNHNWNILIKSNQYNTYGLYLKLNGRGDCNLYIKVKFKIIYHKGEFISEQKTRMELHYIVRNEIPDCYCNIDMNELNKNSYIDVECTISMKTYLP
jgi:hypothetical protein